MKYLKSYTNFFSVDTFVTITLYNYIHIESNFVTLLSRHTIICRRELIILNSLNAIVYTMPCRTLVPFCLHLHKRAFFIFITYLEIKKDIFKCHIMCIYIFFSVSIYITSINNNLLHSKVDI